jgi:hypothetical protein
MMIVHIVFEALTGIMYVLNYWAGQEKTKLDAFKAGEAAATAKAKGATAKDVDEIEVAP